MIEWIVTSCILIVVIIVLRYILKGKISLRLQYALWGPKKPKMAIYTLVVVAFIAAAAVGCTFTGAKEEIEQTDENFTLYDCSGIIIALPNEYIEQLNVYYEAESNVASTLISVYEKASEEAAVADGYVDSGLGWIFSILQYNQTQYEQYLCSDGSGLSFFARDDKWYYGLCTPTDVRFYRHGGVSESELENWEALNGLGFSIQNDFITRNSMTPYSDSEACDNYTYDGEHLLFNYYPYYSVNGSKDEAFTFVLSQPATQGDGGIWCVERFVDGTQGYCILWFPDSGKPATEYYIGLQSECDDGHKPWLIDPVQVAMDFAANSGYWGSTPTEGGVEYIGEATGSATELLQYGEESKVLPLSAEQIEQINEAFAPVLSNSDGSMTINPISCFFTSYYDSVKDIDLAEFMRYFPNDGSVTDECEFNALKALESWSFGAEATLATMPVPVHKYVSESIDEVMWEYAGIHLDDLNGVGTDGGSLLYLKEYDAYYNFTSDFGPGTFTCARGELQGDIIRLYADYGDGGSTMLTQREQDGRYLIVSHQRIDEQ